MVPPFRAAGNWFAAERLRANRRDPFSLFPLAPEIDWPLSSGTMSILPFLLPPRRLLRAGSLLCVTAFLALRLALPGASGAPKPTPKPPFKPPYTVIQSVDATAKTITVGHVNSMDTATTQYKITQFTDIQVNGEKGTVDQLQTGMKVSVTPGSDATVADRIVASPAPK